MRKRRSFSVTIGGFLLIMFPFISYVKILRMFLIKSWPLISFPKYIIQIYISNPLIPLIQLIGIICGIGVLQLKEWARKLTICFASCGIIISLLAFKFTTSDPLAIYIYSIILFGLFIWFFTRSKIKEQFK